MVILSGCLVITDRGKLGDDVKFVTIVNNSNKSIHAMRSFLYPDTTLINAKECDCPHIASKSSCQCHSSSGWKGDIIQNSHEIGIIFLVSEDSLLTILKRFDYTISDFDSAKWTIVYP